MFNSTFQKLSLVLITLAFFSADLCAAGKYAAGKYATSKSVVATQIAVDHYNSQLSYGIPEFKIVGKSYEKYQGHVVILKRVDTQTAEFLDETVAIYHVTGTNVEVLDFIDAFLNEAGNNFNSPLFLDMEYGFKKQLKREISNGNYGYLESFLTETDTIDNHNLLYFSGIFSEVEEFVRFEIMHHNKQAELGEYLGRLGRIQNKSASGISLLNKDKIMLREKMRAFAMQWYMSDLESYSDLDGEVMDGVSVQIKSEKVLEDGKIEITLELFGGLGGMSLGNEKTYKFDTDGQLMRS